MERILIPLIGVSVPIVITAIVFAYVYQHRRMLHLERLALIEKGLNPSTELLEEASQPVQRKRLLTGGITTSAVGVALLIGLGTLGVGPHLLGGLIPLAVGLGQIISYLVSAENEDSQK